MDSTFLNSNELIHAILHGNITKGFPEPPPRVVKIFVSSTKTGMKIFVSLVRFFISFCCLDFECERQHLHEVVAPKLERYCNSHSLDLMFMDPHWQMQPTEPTAAVEPKRPDLVCNGKQSAEYAKQKSPTTVTPIIYDCNSNYINPHEFELQLKEVEDYSHQSISTFFMVIC